MQAAVTPAPAQAELPTDLDVEIIGAGGAGISATPGHTAYRSVLNPPLGERLWFAGEAVSAELYGSLVGARTTGRDTLSSLGITVPA